jgi:hypothetical protein
MELHFAGSSNPAAGCYSSPLGAERQSAQQRPSACDGKTASQWTAAKGAERSSDASEVQGWRGHYLPELDGSPGGTYYVFDGPASHASCMT